MRLQNCRIEGLQERGKELSLPSSPQPFLQSCNPAVLQ
jgi:hypothetical protein